jgi:peptidoglycan/xylan/chitin deacetylase (PgdA/CDA1 family)
MSEHGLVEIGSHTHTHADLRDQVDRFGADLESSVSAIRDCLGISTTLLSFPFGNVQKGFANEHMVAEARRLGMRCGLTTEMALIGPQISPFRWGRFEAAPSDSGATLQAKLEGWYTWMEAGRRMFQAVA